MAKKQMMGKGMHRMPGGRMMSDSEMRREMGKGKAKSKAKPKKRYSKGKRGWDGQVPDLVAVWGWPGPCILGGCLLSLAW